MQEENNQPESTRTQIPITINTSYDHNNKADKVRQQIDLTSYYLGAICWFMKVAAEGYDLLDIQTDHRLYRFEDFRSNVQLLSEIGAGLSDQMTLYSCSIPNFDESAPHSGKIPEPPPISSETEADDFDFGTVDLASGDRLAEVISAVLQNPNLPEPLYNAIKTGLNDVFNDPEMDQSEILEYEQNPEYIAKVLKGWRGETSGGE